MTEFLNNAIKAYNEYVGGYAILAMLIPVGLYFTVYMKFLQVSRFRHAINIVRGKYSTKKTKGDVSSFKALTTALSATVGTGNIVGVALAIHWGGPGAVFWIWVVGFLGMMLKMVECTLAQKYRKINADGSVSGGPMYYMEIGLKDKIGKYAKYLAVVFAVAAILCSFGTGNMAQANSMADALKSSYGIPVIISAIVITSLVLLIIVGGLKRIAEVTSRLVPFMAVSYFIAAVIVLVDYHQAIPAALKLIVTDAFTGTAATGGFLGSTFIMTLAWGVKRGLFSNEAGQGSAPIAHAAAKTEYPIQEGLVASLEPLVDTIIICSLTALVIVVTGVWTLNDTAGVSMTIAGFEHGLSKNRNRLDRKTCRQHWPSDVCFFNSHFLVILRQQGSSVYLGRQSNQTLLLGVWLVCFSWLYLGTRTCVEFCGYGNNLHDNSESYCPYSAVSCFPERGQ
jgi:alanine or glycine:cation symporter, AGCS family